MAARQATVYVRNMLLTVGIIVVPVLLIMALFNRNLGEAPINPVEWRPVLADARAQAPWPVLAPSGLPEGTKAWNVTRATWTKQGAPGRNHEPSPHNEWIWGALSPDRLHYQVVQADGLPQPLIEEFTDKGQKQTGHDELLGRTWERYESPDGRTRSMVSRDPKVVTIVVADTDFGQLQQFARTLSDH